MPPQRRYRPPGTTDGMTLSFPPFTPAVKWLLAINLSIFLLIELFDLSAATRPVVELVINYLALWPKNALHGMVWQFVTYAFIHGGILNIIGVLLGIWFLGSFLESAWGTRRFLIFYLTCALAGGIGSTVLVYVLRIPLGFKIPFAGANGAILGMLAVIGILWADVEFMMIPFPFMIKAKYLVWIAIVVDLVFSFSEVAGILNLGAALGALIYAVLYVKYLDRSFSRQRAYAGAYIGRGLSDRAYDEPTPKKKPSFLTRWRDAYYRWKRRRAARKFEIYMSKHDRKVYFDEHGNYIDPESAENRRRDDDNKKPWVN